MAKALDYGAPTGTSVSGIAALNHEIPPLNYEADYRPVEEGPGKLILTNINAPSDQPETLRIAQTSRANVYAGTSIDPSCYIATKQGTDTIIEFRQIWGITDAADPSYQKYVPVRCALTLSLPNLGLIGGSDVLNSLVFKTVAALALQDQNSAVPGIGALLHGVVARD